MSGPWEIVIYAFDNADEISVGDTASTFNTADLYTVCIVDDDEGPDGDWATVIEEMYETTNMFEAIEYANALAKAKDWPIGKPWCNPNKWSSKIMPLGPVK